MIRKMDTFDDAFFGSVRSILAEARRKAAEKVRAAGLDVEIKVVESETTHVSDMLIEAAAEWHADLLIVGTHGRRGIERFFVGSVAERLVRKGRRSLLLVRGEDPDD